MAGLAIFLSAAKIDSREGTAVGDPPARGDGQQTKASSMPQQFEGRIGGGGVQPQLDRIGAGSGRPLDVLPGLLEALRQH